MSHHFNLNIEQQTALNLISKKVYEKAIGYFGIFGAGGTGKTYTITKIKGSEKFIYLAPTNKAVNVLRESLPFGSIVKTIDSFFKLKISKDWENNDVFQYTMPDLNKLPKVIVIDEISMISESQLNLIDALSKNTLVVCLGDNMQLPPIADNKNKYFDENGFQVSKIFLEIKEFVILTIQNRQKKESELFKLINGFRNNMDKKIDARKIAEIKNNGSDILYINQNSIEFIDFVKSNDVVAIGHKNATCSLLSYKIQKIKTNKEKIFINKIEEGEKVYFYNFYQNEDVRYYTSDIVTVKKLVNLSIKIIVPLTGKVFEFNVIQATVTDGFVTNNIWLNNSENNIKLRGYIYYIKNKTNCKKELAELNTFYSEYKNKFATLKKPHSITCHKAQGSSFDSVLIPVYDYYSKDHKYANQLLYVAMSRAKKNIVFLEGNCNFNKSNYRVNFTEEEKYLIASSQDWKCKISNEEINDRDFDIHHDKPLSNGGTNDINNLMAITKEEHKKIHSEVNLNL
jgi:hypothetical protein